MRSLTPAQRHRVLARALARALLTAAVLVVLYYALPLTVIGTASTATLLAAGLVCVILVIVYEIPNHHPLQLSGNFGQ